MTNSLPIIIGIAGGAASGKSSIAQAIVNSFGPNASDIVRVMPQELFHKHISIYLADGPDSIDFGQHMVAVLTSFRNDYAWEISPVIILEGVYAFYEPHLVAMLNMKVFVECDSDIALARYIRRDISDKSIDQILDSYEKYMKPAFDKWIVQQRAAADIIIPNSKDAPVDSLKSICLIHDYIQSSLATLK